MRRATEGPPAFVSAFFDNEVRGGGNGKLGTDLRGCSSSLSSGDSDHGDDGGSSSSSSGGNGFNVGAAANAVIFPGDRLAQPGIPQPRQRGNCRAQGLGGRPDAEGRRAGTFRIRRRLSGGRKGRLPSVQDEGGVPRGFLGEARGGRRPSRSRMTGVGILAGSPFSLAQRSLHVILRWKSPASVKMGAAKQK